MSSEAAAARRCSGGTSGFAAGTSGAAGAGSDGAAEEGADVGAGDGLARTPALTDSREAGEGFSPGGSQAASAAADATTASARIFFIVFSVWRMSENLACIRSFLARVGR
ncbi:hypothetical protein HMPREF3227_01806 [Corynebacterium sp. CMW7794]|nr:hypothetical protein HMPREF3227_01806 [Corynebacterium sp. CMW7794]